MQNRQAPTFFERGRLRQPCASAQQKWRIDRPWAFWKFSGIRRGREWRRTRCRAFETNDKRSDRREQPASNFANSETAPGDRLRSAEFRSNSFARYQGGLLFRIIDWN